MLLAYLSLGIVPYVFASMFDVVFAEKFHKKNAIAMIFFVITGLFFLINQSSNSGHAPMLHDLKSISNLLASYAVNILWLTWPGIIWLILDCFAKLKFDLYLLGLASVHFPAWIASVLLMHTDSRDALGWIIVPFLQAYMFLVSLIIYHIAKKISRQSRNSGI